MKEKVKKIIALVLTFLMSIGCVQSYPMVSALESDYEVYPNPHMMEYQDGSFDITSNVNIVYEDGIDEYTRDRLNEVLAIKKINATTSTEVKEDQTNILVGIKGSNQYVDQYAGEHYTVKTNNLFDQLDSYLLKVDNGKITVLGKDTDAAFYGLTSLYHIFKQLDGTNIRNFTMEDYANVASRGFIEGYYGNPWSTTDRIKLMEWGGYYKLNSYFYAPKDDPKHNSKWRELYTNEEIETKITDRTKIVGIAHVSNVLGTINNVKKIIKYAHKKGAIVIVDASQSIPHMKIDVQDLDADFLVFSGHKMLAPLGIGVLYGKREILNKMTPFLMGGDMIEYVYEQETTYAPLPNKFEAGTQNVEGVVGLGAAIDYIQNIGYDKMQELENDVLAYARQELSKLDYLTLYMTPNEKNHSSVISFNIKGVHPHDVASILDSEGVCVRSGNHCAQPLMRFLGIDSTCRASFYFYNTKEDVDRLVHALNKAYDMFKKFIK